MSKHVFAKNEVELLKILDCERNKNLSRNKNSIILLAFHKPRSKFYFVISGKTFIC